MPDITAKISQIRRDVDYAELYPDPANFDQVRTGLRILAGMVLEILAARAQYQSLDIRIAPKTDIVTTIYERSA